MIFFNEPMNAFTPKKVLVGAGKSVLSRKMNRLLWRNSKANQTIMGKHRALPRPQRLQLVLATHPTQFPPLIPGDQNPRTENLRLFSLGRTGRLVWDPRVTWKYIVCFYLLLLLILLLLILICLSNTWNFLTVKTIQITDKANIHLDPPLPSISVSSPEGTTGLCVVVSFYLEHVDMKSPIFKERSSRHKELRLQISIRYKEQLVECKGRWQRKATFPGALKAYIGLWSENTLAEDRRMD